MALYRVPFNIREIRDGILKNNLIPEQKKYLEKYHDKN